VDEYQDIGPEQYELISALAGRSAQDEEGRLSLFAVGDDDQNIYAFDGASVEFIRRFEIDYAAKPAYLTDNYRSTAHIIAAANLLIQPASRRMKNEHPIAIDRARRKAPAGGDWKVFDRMAQGRVQILPAGGDALTQAVAVMGELERLSHLAPAWEWARAAVIAREWKFLDPIRSYCELNGIPVQMADEETPQFWRLRETQRLIEWLYAREVKLVDTIAIGHWLNSRPTGPWWALLREAVEEYGLETRETELPIGHFIEWLVEWGREVRRRQAGLMLLTAHRAKGLEFDHVAVLDGGWERVGRNEDRDAVRRLYYVAMTRAAKTLTLAHFDRAHALLDALPKDASFLLRAPTHLPAPTAELARRYWRLTPREVDLGFAGRFKPGHFVHQAIASLTANDPLTLRQQKGRWELLDHKERTVGRLSKAFTPLKDMTCIEARVDAIISRRRKECEPEYGVHVRCERWEVIIPELVFSDHSFPE
jgi:ATP-dependent DNA helicase RecQ